MPQARVGADSTRPARPADSGAMIASQADAPRAGSASRTVVAVASKNSDISTIDIADDAAAAAADPADPVAGEMSVAPADPPTPKRDYGRTDTVQVAKSEIKKRFDKTNSKRIVRDPNFKALRDKECFGWRLPSLKRDKISPESMQDAWEEYPWGFF